MSNLWLIIPARLKQVWRSDLNTSVLLRRHFNITIDTFHFRLKSFDLDRQCSLGKQCRIFRDFIKSVSTNKSDVPSWIPYPFLSHERVEERIWRRGKARVAVQGPPKTCLKYFAYVTLWSAKGVSQRHVLFYHWLILLDVEIPLANISSD